VDSALFNDSFKRQHKETHGLERQ